jgi:hypothetical protein
MGARGKNGFHHLRGGCPTVGRPPDQPLWGPFHIMTVGRGHVHGDGAVAPFEVRAQVARYTGPFVEEFDHLSTHAHLELLLNEGIGHRIVVAFDFHVIINRVVPQ